MQRSICNFIQWSWILHQDNLTTCQIYVALCGTVAAIFLWLIHPLLLRTWIIRLLRGVENPGLLRLLPGVEKPGLLRLLRGVAPRGPSRKRSWLGAPQDQLFLAFLILETSRHVSLASFCHLSLSFSMFCILQKVFATVQLGPFSFVGIFSILSKHVSTDRGLPVVPKGPGHLRYVGGCGVLTWTSMMEIGKGRRSISSGGLVARRHKTLVTSPNHKYWRSEHVSEAYLKSVSPNACSEAVATFWP